MLLQTILVLSILGVGMYLSVRAGKLTEGGALTGGCLGLAIFLGAGFTGLAILAAFFLTGTGATAWRQKYKASLGLAEENKGRRTASQAFANAGVAGILGLLNFFLNEYTQLLPLMLAAAFASATADTLSSELGNVYGTRFYNILTWQPDSRGLNGVISAEGTFLGFLGSTLIGIIYSFGFGISWHIFIVIIAGTAGNLTDSVLGATLERSRYLSNNAVNLLNTTIAAIVAGILFNLIN